MSDPSNRNKTALEVVKESGGVIMVRGTPITLDNSQSTFVYLPPDKGWQFITVTPDMSAALWRPPSED